MPRLSEPPLQPSIFWLISVLLFIIIGYFTAGYISYTFFGSALDNSQIFAAVITLTPFVIYLGGLVASMVLFVYKKHALAWKVLMIEVITILLFIVYTILISWRG